MKKSYFDSGGNDTELIAVLNLCQPRSEPSSETDLRCGALSGTPYRAGKGPRGISDGGRDRRHGRGTDPVPGVFERNGGTFRSDADGHEE